MTALLGYVVVLGGLLVAAVWLVRRSERRLGAGPDAHAAPTQLGTDVTAEITAYLDRMTGELALPAADVAEVRAELADHLQDSIASLEAEGLDRDRAIREALGRLGPAADLGRQLRMAHQSTKRLLAGVGGGVFAGGGGFVLGYLGGIMLALFAALALALATPPLAAVGLRLPDITSGDHSGNAINSIFLAVATAIAAGAATRYAVRTSASLSRRTPRSVAAFWAVGGGLGFGWWAIFGMRGAQSWPSVAIELCVPVVAAVAAFARIERSMPHVGRWALVVGLVAVVGSGLVFAVAGSVSSSVINTIGQQPDLHLDSVAPAAPTAWLPEDANFGGGWGSDWSSGGTQVSLELDPNLGAPAIAAILANWRDVRFEAWHALPIVMPGLPAGIDTRYSSPTEVQSASLSDTSFEAVFHLERFRNSGSWWIVLTAVGPDGHRYRLESGMGGDARFNGSAWDWLTAPQ